MWTQSSVTMRSRSNLTVGSRILQAFANYRPLFRYLLVTYDTSLQVYSVANSLLVRRIALPLIGANSGAPYIVASALSPTSPNLVWLAASDGRIWRIDWTTGSGVTDLFRTKAGVIHDMTIGAVSLNKQLRDVLFVAESLKSSYKLVAYDPSDLVNPQSQILHDQPGRVNIVRATTGGAAIVAAAVDTLVVGVLKQKGLHKVEDLAYDFYSLNTTDTICCLSVRHTSKKNASKKKATSEPTELAVDVAVGCARGAILVYSDLVAQLRGKARKGLDTPKKQHWHQRAVHSLAWSNDGKLSNDNHSKSKRG